MKWVSGLSKLILSAVLISGISMYTTWFTVQLYMEDVLQKFNLPTSQKSLSVTDWVSQLAGQIGLMKAANSGTASAVGSGSEPEKEKKGAAGSPVVPSANRTAPTSDDASASAAASANDGKDQAASAADPFQQEAVSVWSQTANTAQTEQQKNKVVISAENFYKTKEKLSDEDKMQIFSILINRLPQEDLQKISGYVENGITQDELKKIDEIVKKSLKSEEYEKLVQILEKY